MAASDTPLCEPPPITQKHVQLYQYKERGGPYSPETYRHQLWMERLLLSTSPAHHIADGMPLTQPWSKQHKRVTRADAGGMRYNLSNSYAQPLTNQDLISLTRARGDHSLIEAYNDHGLGYTPNGGSADLREEIANMYGSAIHADNVIVFTGAQVALQTAAMALTSSHTHAITFDPAYQSTQEAPVHAGAQVTTITLRAANNWQVDPAEVRAAIRENTRYLVLNEPYNPAGTLMSVETQSQLIRIADEHGIYILSDEGSRVHSSRSQRPSHPPLSLAALAARIPVCRCDTAPTRHCVFLACPSATSQPLPPWPPACSAATLQCTVSWSTTRPTGCRQWPMLTAAGSAASRSPSHGAAVESPSAGSPSTTSRSGSG